VEVYDIRPILAPTISLVCAGMVFLLGQNKHWRRFWMLSAAVLKLVVVMSMLPGSLAGTVYVFNMIDFTPGIGIGFRADALGHVLRGCLIDAVAVHHHLRHRVHEG
jgi:multicomponent Na+:H+ antiporter subunit D